MEEIKKILAPTDLSELSKAGVRYALKLAKALGAEITVYHAVDYETLTRYGERSDAPASFPPADQQFLDRYQNALAENSWPIVLVMSIRPSSPARRLN